MTQPTRLFDCLEMHLENASNHIMVAGKENGAYREYTTSETANIVNRLSAGLLQMGYGQGDGTAGGRDKIAVIAKNRPEWVFLDLAVQQIGAVLTPIYPTIGEPELAYILNDAKVKVIFLNDESLLEKINQIKSSTPRLEKIYTFDKCPTLPFWKEVSDKATKEDLEKVKEIAAKIQYEDLATIIYTSGTTGKPKGVMLSHKNILSNVMDSMPCFPPGDNMKSLSFLPLNHIFERMVCFLYLFNGTSVYFAESLETISDNLKEVKPQMFTTVPRVLEKVYEAIMAKGEELTGIKRKLFFWAHGLANRFEINQNMGWWYRTQLSLANKIIFNKWREALGSQILCIISGGAACQVRLIRIFTAARLIIMEGYGLTETSPVISVNRYEEEDRMFGTVGPLIDNVEVKIADDGEILCKGPNIMMGYYKQPELTREVMEGEWFKTGDIGTMIDQKFLKITDRKKEMFKTSGGKYVAPIAIENKMKESRFIENIMIVGAGEKFVSALVIPALDNLNLWSTEQGINVSNTKELLKNDKVLKLYHDQINKYNTFFSHTQQIKKFELLPEPWSIETHEMTPKLSLRRKIIMEKYKDRVRHIYDNNSKGNPAN